MTGGGQENYEQVLAVPLAFGRIALYFANRPWRRDFVRQPTTVRLHRVPFRVSAHTGDDR